MGGGIAKSSGPAGARLVVWREPGCPTARYSRDVHSSLTRSRGAGTPEASRGTARSVIVVASGSPITPVRSRIGHDQLPHTKTATIAWLRASDLVDNHEVIRD